MNNLVIQFFSFILIFYSAECGYDLKSVGIFPKFKDRITFYVMTTDNGDLVPAIFRGPAPKVTIDLRQNVRFYLYNRKRRDSHFQLYINDSTNLQESGFDVNNETKIIIHGFANSVQSDVVQVIKNRYLNENWYNVIAVDWSDLCSPPYYNSAVENINAVGGYVSQMIDYLIQQNLPIELIHVIGHSLGAHVAGSSGHQVTSGTLPRITGLDPAKPLFDISSTDNRLDPTDAQFVDCIHTCGGYLGFYEPICSVDFYPNGGTDPQPGCTWDVFGMCSHGRSIHYFAESIINIQPFVAMKCTTLDDLKETSCDKEKTTSMGSSIETNTSGIYYLRTSSWPPFITNNSFANIGFFQKFLWFFF